MIGSPVEGAGRESRHPGDEFHRDPADRILAATARVHDLTLATADERLLANPHVLSLNALA